MFCNEMSVQSTFKMLKHSTFGEVGSRLVRHRGPRYTVVTLIHD